jgi:hypothetical protein
MVGRLPVACRFVLLAVVCLLFLGVPASAQQLAKRLILKDGSYQLVTEWEVQGDRVRYLSAERNEWEELPKDLVDWDATEKFAQDRTAGIPDAQAVQIDKEMKAEEEAEQARTPLVAPGLRLPKEGSVVLLDTFQNQPELVELQQNAGELNRNRGKNLLRAAIIPIPVDGKQTIELPQVHATVQAHVGVPSIYVDVEPSQELRQASQSATARPTGAAQPEQPQPPIQPAQPIQPEQPWDRFHIVRTEIKGGKRIVANIKVSPLGKANPQQNLVPTTSQRLTGNWVKVTPTEPLSSGEYAVVELLGKDGMNTYVWDFGVNPSAPANAGALKPEMSAPPSTPAKQAEPAKPIP